MQSGYYHKDEIRKCSQCRFCYPCLADTKKKLCKEELIRTGRPMSAFNVDPNQLGCTRWERREGD